MLAVKVDVSSKNQESSKSPEKVSILESIRRWIDKTFGTSLSELTRQTKADIGKSRTVANTLQATTNNPEVAKAAEALEEASNNVEESRNSSSDIQDQQTIAVLQAEAALVESGKKASVEDQANIKEFTESLSPLHQEVLEKFIQDKPLASTSEAQTDTHQAEQGLSLGEQSVPQADQAPQVESATQGQGVSFEPQQQMNSGEMLSEAPVTTQIASRPKSPFGGADFMSGAKKLRSTPVEIVSKPEIDTTPVQDEKVLTTESQDDTDRIQELRNKGNSKSMQEAAELRRLTAPKEQVVTMDSIQSSRAIPKIQETSEQAADKRRQATIDKLILDKNQDKINTAVEGAVTTYNKANSPQSLGFSKYQEGLAKVKTDATTEAVTDIKNQYATNSDGSPRSNQEILKDLQGPVKIFTAKPVSQNGPQLDQVDEIAVNNIMRTANKGLKSGDQGYVSRDQAIETMKANKIQRAADKEAEKASNRAAVQETTVSGSGSSVSSSEPVVSQFALNKVISKTYESRIQQDTEGLTGKALADAKKESIANIKKNMSTEELSKITNEAISIEKATAEANAKAEASRAAERDAAQNKGKQASQQAEQAAQDAITYKSDADEAEANLGGNPTDEQISEARLNAINQAKTNAEQKTASSTLSEEDISLVNKKILQENATEINDALNEAISKDSEYALASPPAQMKFKKDLANTMRLKMSNEEQEKVLQQAKDGAEDEVQAPARPANPMLAGIGGPRPANPMLAGIGGPRTLKSVQ